MARHNPCPRCGGQLVGWNDPDTSCLQCGHIVYRRTALFGPERLDLDVGSDDETVPHRPEQGNQRRGEPK